MAYAHSATVIPFLSMLAQDYINGSAVYASYDRHYGRKPIGRATETKRGIMAKKRRTRTGKRKNVYKDLICPVCGNPVEYYAGRDAFECISCGRRLDIRVNKHVDSDPPSPTTTELNQLAPSVQKFASGATSSKHLPMYDLIPACFLRRTAKRFTYGAKKHGKFNYKRGLHDKDFILDRLNHAFVHLKNAIDAIQADEMTEDDNLGAVAVNIAMGMEYESANGLAGPHD